MSLVYALVVDSVYLFDIVGKLLYFGMVEIVVVFVCDILVYTVQKYWVENSHHHLMINSSNNKVFFFVVKMGNFHCDLAEGVN